MATAKEIGKEQVIKDLINKGLDAGAVTKIVNENWAVWQNLKVTIAKNRAARIIESMISKLFPVAVRDHFKDRTFQEKTWLYCLGTDPLTDRAALFSYFITQQDDDGNGVCLTETLELGVPLEISGSRWRGTGTNIRMSGDPSSIVQEKKPRSRTKAWIEKETKYEQEMYLLAKDLVVDLPTWISENDQSMKAPKKQSNYEIFLVESSFGNIFAAQDWVDAEGEFNKDGTQKRKAVDNEIGFAYEGDYDDGRYGPFFRFMIDCPVQNYSIRVTVNPQILGEVGLLTLGDGEWKNIDASVDKLGEFQMNLSGLPAIFILQTKKWHTWEGKVTLDCILIAAINIPDEYSNYTVTVHGGEREPNKNETSGVEDFLEKIEWEPVALWEKMEQKIQEMKGLINNDSAFILVAKEQKYNVMREYVDSLDLSEFQTYLDARAEEELQEVVKKVTKKPAKKATKKITRKRSKKAPKKAAKKKVAPTSRYPWANSEVIDTLESNNWDLPYSEIDLIWDQLGVDEKEIPPEAEYNLYIEETINK